MWKQFLLYLRPVWLQSLLNLLVWLGIKMCLCPAGFSTALFIPLSLSLSCMGFVVHQASASSTSPRRAGFLIVSLANLTPLDQTDCVD